uniref:Uncharacterized protein n=1 Tax=Glossina pallidipes TaxID=7398 RepID=A0A1B0A818_GLOPL
MSETQIKGPHALRAKRCLSCDSGMDRNKASVSKRGPTIETTMNSRQVAFSALTPIERVIKP